MGLDNGIEIRLKRQIDDPILDHYFRIDCDGQIVYEVAYWRKCYNVRERILQRVFAPDGDELFEYPLDIDDIDFVIETIEDLCDPEEWKSGRGSIFSYDDMHDILIQQIQNLKKLKTFMRTYPDDIDMVYFYDSY